MSIDACRKKPRQVSIHDQPLEAILRNVINNPMEISFLQVTAIPCKFVQANPGSFSIRNDLRKTAQKHSNASRCLLILTDSFRNRCPLGTKKSTTFIETMLINALYEKIPLNCGRCLAVLISFPLEKDIAFDSRRNGRV